MLSQLRNMIQEESPQFLVYLLISIIVGGFTGVLFFLDPTVFQKYLGNLNPVLMVLLMALLGFGLLLLQKSRGWFEIAQRENLRGFGHLAILTLPIALFAITADFLIGFPEDTNVLFPLSLMFYPTMDFVVQVLFHLLPITILFIPLSRVKNEEFRERLIWFILIVVSLLEPVLQIIWSADAGDPIGIVTFTGMNVFLVNILEVYTFRRLDFASMYGIRLVYYLLWHIIWGYLRLLILPF